MSAPPGFNPNASMLPDPGASSAPIHVMKGGGIGVQSGGFTPDEQKILKEYGLDTGGSIADEIDEPTKVAFVRQIESGVCGVNAGESVVLKKNCWAVVQVIRALIKKNIKSANVKPLPGSISLNGRFPMEAYPGASSNEKFKAYSKSKLGKEPPQLISELGRPTPVATPSTEAPGTGGPAESSPVPDLPSVDVPEETTFNTPPEIPSVLSSVSPSSVTPELTPPVEEPNIEITSELLTGTNIEEEPSNFKGNSSGKTASVNINLTRNNSKRYKSNILLKTSHGTRKLRIRGNSPQRILNRYNFEKKANIQKSAKAVRQSEYNAKVKKQSFNKATEEKDRLRKEAANLEKKKIEMEKELAKQEAEVKAKLSAAAKEKKNTGESAGVKKPLGKKITNAYTRLRGKFTKKARITRRKNRK